MNAFAILTLVTTLGFARQDGAQPPSTTQTTLADIDAAIERGARWLRMAQQDDGAFSPEDARGTCRVALTAMALWSLNEPQRSIEDADAVRAARVLLTNCRDDGGIYDPARGLAVYTSGVSSRALRTLGKRPDWPELGSALANVELFTYRRVAPDSIVDAVQPGETSVAQSREVARSLLDTSKPSEDGKRKALEFLSRCEQDSTRAPARVRSSLQTGRTDQIGPFGYDDLLPFVYFDLAPEQQIALRAREALRAYYTPERNPDLTKRYGGEGFVPGTQGLFYYYFLVSKALTCFRQPALVTADGTSHVWADEIAARLVRAQRPSGEWSNPDPQWWEGEPVLATSYALLTLKLCRASLATAKR